MRSTRAREVQMATNFGVGQLYKRKDFLETEDEAKIHPNRTYYFRKSVDLDELVRQCDRTLLNDATNAKALFVRASSSMKLKRYERAIEDYTRLIALNPRDTVSIYKRGAAYERLNRMNESIRDYSDVLRPVVGARRYVASCERVADSGPARSVVSLRFVNTNALLGASADDRISWTCDGLKTGWTRRAGGCLTTHVSPRGGDGER